MNNRVSTIKSLVAGLLVSSAVATMPSHAVESKDPIKLTLHDYP